MGLQINSASAMQYKFFAMLHNAISCKALHNADAEKCKGEAMVILSTANAKHS